MSWKLPIFVTIFIELEIFGWENLDYILVELILDLDILPMDSLEGTSNILWKVIGEKVDVCGSRKCQSGRCLRSLQTVTAEKFKWPYLLDHLTILAEIFSVSFSSDILPPQEVWKRLLSSVMTVIFDFSN